MTEMAGWLSPKYAVSKIMIISDYCLILYKPIIVLKAFVIPKRRNIFVEILSKSKQNEVLSLPP